MHPYNAYSTMLSIIIMKKQIGNDTSEISIVIVLCFIFVYIGVGVTLEGFLENRKCIFPFTVTRGLPSMNWVM